MNISIWVLAVVFIVIAVRRIGPVHVPIWQAMGGGALAVLLAGEMPWREAWEAVDWEVMVFLFGMFVVGQALVASGYLYYLAYRLFGRIASGQGLLLAVLFGMGLTSALLMNDTLAIIGTPLALRLAREHELDESMMLLAVAFSVTLGSLMSPIGNPQNLLVATHGHLAEPFIDFLAALAVPSLLNLALAFLWLRRVYRRTFHEVVLLHRPVAVLDQDLARLSRLSLWIVVVLTGCKIALALSDASFQFGLSSIALAAAAPLLLFSRERGAILRHLDWPILLFSAAMFVLMASVWSSGFFQGWLSRLPFSLHGMPAVLAVSLGLSQLISNVPLVALYLPILSENGAGLPELMALAAGSTLAGNLLILGAASNVIIIQHAEKHGATLGFFQFARIGIPLTLINLLVYWAWLSWYFR